jgi:hypothetical protein
MRHTHTSLERVDMYNSYAIYIYIYIFHRLGKNLETKTPQKLKGMPPAKEH